LSGWTRFSKVRSWSCIGSRFVVRGRVLRRTRFYRALATRCQLLFRLLAGRASTLAKTDPLCGATHKGSVLTSAEALSVSLGLRLNFLSADQRELRSSIGGACAPPIASVTGFPVTGFPERIHLNGVARECRVRPDGQFIADHAERNLGECGPMVFDIRQCWRATLGRLCA